jgi:hypothetical protein
MILRQAFARLEIVPDTDPRKLHHGIAGQDENDPARRHCPQGNHGAGGSNKGGSPSFSKFISNIWYVQFNRNLFPSEGYEASFRPSFHVGDWINMMRVVKEQKHNDFWSVPFKRI